MSGVLRRPTKGIRAAAGMRGIVYRRFGGIHPFLALMILGSSAGLEGAAREDPMKTAGHSADPTAANSVYRFTVRTIDGREVSLSTYEGDVLMIVNVASL